MNEILQIEAIIYSPPVKEHLFDIEASKGKNCSTILHKFRDSFLSWRPRDYMPDVWLHHSTAEEVKSTSFPALCCARPRSAPLMEKYDYDSAAER